MDPAGLQKHFRYFDSTGPGGPAMTFAGFGGDYLTTSGTFVYWRKSIASDPATGAVDITFYRCDGTAAPTVVRQVTMDGLQVSLAEFFLPYQFYVVGNRLLFTWWTAASAPVVVALIPDSGTTVHSMPGLSLAWASLAGGVNPQLLIAGPSKRPSSSEDFAFATDFSARIYFSSNDTSLIYAAMLGNILSAFLTDSGPTLICQANPSQSAPRSFYPVLEQSGVTANQLLLGNCPSMNSWTEFVRFIPKAFTSGTVYYHPLLNVPYVMQKTTGGCP